MIIKRLVSSLDSDWSAAVFYSRYSTTMTASANQQHKQSIAQYFNVLCIFVMYNVLCIGRINCLLFI